MTIDPNYSNDLDYSSVPEEYREEMRLYFEAGIEPGRSLRAVLENDLIETVGLFFDGRDEASLGVKLVALSRWLYNEAPGRSHGPWGSREAVNKHLALDWTEVREAMGFTR